MVEEVKTFKVFIASPGDCKREREIVRRIIDVCDTMYYESHNIHIILLGWEDTVVPGGNRPQSEINEDLDDCDLIVLCMYRRWGTVPGESEYTSGTEEEFYRAWERFEKTGTPWVYTFFRIVGAEFLADPGEQLKKVIEFKDKIRTGREPFSRKILYKEYYLPEDRPEEHLDFEKLLTKAIAKWIGNMLDGGRRAFPVGDDNGTPPDVLESKLADKEKALEKALGKIEELEKKQRLTVSENAEKQAIELALIGRELVEKGTLSEAETLFVKAIETYPEEPGIMLEYGDLIYDMGRFEAAVEAYDKAIKLKPDYAEAYNNKGVALEDLRKYDEAVKAYDKAIELKPDYADAYYNKGVALDDMRKYDEALNAFDKAVELKTNDAIAYDGKSVVFIHLGLFKKAVEATDTAIELNPDYANAYFNRACAYSLLGEKDKMLSDLRKVIELESKNRDDAKNETDFDAYRDDPDFRRLIYPEEFEGEESE